MLYTLIKVLVTSLLIVTLSELSKRSSLLGALLASLPLTSILAMLWLYIDTKEAGKVAEFASNIFWLVIPSLVFFISLPIFLKKGLAFYLSMGLSISMTAGFYFLMLTLLTRYGIKF
ncbi:MAG: DUF3147 family protein [Methylococcales bacterium]